MQRLVDPIQYMSFRNLSWEVIHEVERNDHRPVFNINIS